MIFQGVFGWQRIFKKSSTFSKQVERRLKVAAAAKKNVLVKIVLKKSIMYLYF